MTGPAITPEQLRYVDAGELLALMAGTLALRVRTHEDCELLDAIGREFRSRNSPDDPDPWANEANVSPEEWECVRPYIFGDQAAA